MVALFFKFPFPFLFLNSSLLVDLTNLYISFSQERKSNFHGDRS